MRVVRVMRVMRVRVQMGTELSNSLKVRVPLVAFMADCNSNICVYHSGVALPRLAARPAIDCPSVRQLFGFYFLLHLP